MIIKIFDVTFLISAALDLPTQRRAILDLHFLIIWGDTFVLIWNFKLLSTGYFDSLVDNLQDQASVKR